MNPKVADLFAVESSVPMTRRRFWSRGSVLMLLKYLGELALVFGATGAFYSPLRFLNPLLSQRLPSPVTSLPMYLGLFAWTLPFIWIGFGHCYRRLIDSGRDGWLALLFFVPVVNLLFFVMLGLLPSAPLRSVPDPLVTGRASPDLKSALEAFGLALVLGIPLTLFSVFVARSYGFALFFTSPLLIGVVIGYWVNRKQLIGLARTLQIAFIATLILGGTLLLLALEGALCLAMAFPIAATLVHIGAAYGRLFARQRLRWSRSAIFVIAITPVSMFVDARLPHVPVRQIVESRIVIAAPPATVWRHVVTFEPIADPTEWYFKAGVAYPLRARIVKEGDRLVRYCEFTTGAFVEPIRVWEENRRLAFDVTYTPRPMRELSPYEEVYAPHLDGFFGSRFGEFELRPLDGGRSTELVGRTHYELGMAPATYWNAFADWIIHRIHLRVLRHIEQASVRDAG